MRPTVAEARLGAMEANLRAVKGLVGEEVGVMAVVKADAYGHGAVPVARALAGAGVDALGVVLVCEGVELREAGLELPILVMGTPFADDFDALVTHDLAASLDTLGAARALDAAAARAGQRAAWHLKVDTGMNRLGVRSEDAVALATEAAKLDHLDFTGVFTHFACAECGGHPTIPAQLKRFSQVLAGLRAAAIRPETIHAANSSATITLPATHYTMVRPGLALYGIAPSPEAAARVALEPALSVRTRVARIKRVREGEGVSYGHTWRASRESTIGVLPVGYGDGYPRALSNRGRVRAGGALAPVVGAVCMDATMVDLTDVPGAAEGTEVTVLEADAASPLSAAAIAETAGTIPYEILTGLTKRVPRVYV